MYRVPVPDCKDENENKAKNTYAFKVRAVNRNPLNPAEPYYGEWSTPGMVSCVLPGNLRFTSRHSWLNILFKFIRYGTREDFILRIDDDEV